jgi:hypothetical protein
MAAPAVAIATAALRNPRRAWQILLILAALVGLYYMLLIGIYGSLFGLRPLQGGYDPSKVALAEIPAEYLQLYQRAGERYGIDPWILAAIGAIETRHGTSTAPGVRSGVNRYGCCAGPMQFSLVGSPSTWDRYGVDGNRDGRRSPYDPEDAILAAARYLRASGAPADYPRAIFAYNHADWYVAEVLAQAELYRGAAISPAGSPGETASIGELLANRRIILTPGQRVDLRAGGIDERLLATLAWIGRRHSVVITSLRADHYPGTNHERGRAIDIGAVDGEVCRGARFGACAELVRELAAVTGATRSTELIYWWDPDGPLDPRGFARADHCDHIHWGMDA